MNQPLTSMFAGLKMANLLLVWIESKDGTWFVDAIAIVEDHEGFAKTILPLYYKHCKFASFVRQLNMYDFHKIPAVQQGALFANNQHDLWEFSHEHFYRGCNDKLTLVTRKRNKNLESSTARRSLTLAKLVRDIASIRKHQADITSDLTSLQNDNATLWQESFAAREKHQQHQDVLNKILQFLTTVFSNEDNLLHATAQQLRGPFMLGKDNEYISLTGQPGMFILFVYKQDNDLDPPLSLACTGSQNSPLIISFPLSVSLFPV